MALTSKRRRAADAAKGVADAAREIAEGDNLREFASSTGSAVREFVGHVSEAAKELLEAAGGHEESGSPKNKKKAKKRKRGKIRRTMRLGAIVGVAVAVFGNRTAREKIASQVRKLRGEKEPPSWTSENVQADGAARTEPAPVNPTA